MSVFLLTLRRLESAQITMHSNKFLKEKKLRLNTVYILTI